MWDGILLYRERENNENNSKQPTAPFNVHVLSISPSLYYFFRIFFEIFLSKLISKFIHNIYYQKNFYKTQYSLGDMLATKKVSILIHHKGRWEGRGLFIFFFKNNFLFFFYFFLFFETIYIKYVGLVH